MDHAAAPTDHVVQRHVGMAVRYEYLGWVNGTVTLQLSLQGALSTCIATWVPAAVPNVQLTEVQRQRLDALLARVQVPYDPDNEAHQVMHTCMHTYTHHGCSVYAHLCVLEASYYNHPCTEAA